MAKRGDACDSFSIGLSCAFMTATLAQNFSHRRHRA